MNSAHRWIDIAFDLVEDASHVVERTHRAVVARGAWRRAPVEPVRRVADVISVLHTTTAGGVYTSIRVVNALARFGVSTVADAIASGIERASGPGDPTRQEAPGSATERTSASAADHLLATINGFWGDFLGLRSSRLDLGMTLRWQGRDVAISREALSAAYPRPTSKICVLVHGLASTERSWEGPTGAAGAEGVAFGSKLHEDLGYTPIYLLYNTGRHISENGRALARLLTQVLHAYPVPIEEIALVGHSMGGLVARSAAYYANADDEPWIALLRHVACIGAPNLGAPLEQGIGLLTWALRRMGAIGAQIPAEILASRSAGVKDLRHGYTTDEEWEGKDPDAAFADARSDLPLVDGVGYYFLAATVSRDPAHPLGWLLGDLMVRLPSATGDAVSPARRIRFNDGAVLPGVWHYHLTRHPAVYQALRDLLGTKSP